MRAILITICVLTLFTGLAFGEEMPIPMLDPQSHVQFGLPQGTPEANITIKREIYTLCNNAQTKFADWVAYVVTAETMAGNENTKRNWKRDPALPEEATLSPADYKGASDALKIDRGHQAPLASFKGTEFWEETNYLSNITPQAKELNQGAWVRVENAERDLAEHATVYVITGPLYERDMPPMPNASKEHRVPSGYWKIIGVQNPDKALGQPPLVLIGFIFDQNTPRSAPELEHTATVDQIEERSHLNFFPDLPDDVEERMESSNKLVLQ
jgi:endonuclease G